MAVIYSVAVKDARLNAVVDAIDAGSGPGTLEIGTAGMGAVLATLTLDEPSATVSGGVLTLAGTPLESTASGTGEAASARIRDSDGNDVITGLEVSEGGTDIILDSVSITTGQTVRITSGVITHG